MNTEKLFSSKERIAILRAKKTHYNLDRLPATVALTGALFPTEGVSRNLRPGRQGIPFLGN